MIDRITELLKHPDLPAWVLELLSDDKDGEVRHHVAIHPSTPVDVLKTLASDEKLGVVSGVAQNRSTPSSVLLEISNVAVGYIWDDLLENPSTPIEALLPILLLDIPEDEKNEVIEDSRFAPYVRNWAVEVGYGTDIPLSMLKSLYMNWNKK